MHHLGGAMAGFNDSEANKVYEKFHGSFQKVQLN